MMLIQAYLRMSRKYYLAGPGKFDAESIKLAYILREILYLSGNSASQIPELHVVGACAPERGCMGIFDLSQV